jgi:hypothetical protein
VVAVADLGGLGVKQGSPVTYDWTSPSLMPLALPWLAILLLLALKPNRCAQAWWIWLPLACVEVLGNAPQAAFRFLPSAVFDVFVDLIGALAFGLAAVWLLSTYLGRTRRFLTFLAILFALAGVSVSTFVVRQGWDIANFETLQIGILLAACVFVISVALSVAGLLCRGRYRPLLFLLGLMAFLLAIWSVLITPFFVFALVASGGVVAMTLLIAAVLVMAGVSFIILLPFLVLSFTSAFFRDGIKRLLHWECAVLPASNTPPIITASNA